MVKPCRINYLHIIKLLHHLGCDYTSSFYGKGKVKALKLARANEKFVSAFSNLGSSEVVSEKTMNDLDLFTCPLFGDQTATTLNDARYNAFTKGKFGEDCLPPNKDALLLHITRANYVAYIWRRCMNPTIDAPDFCNHGWHTLGKNVCKIANSKCPNFLSSVRKLTRDW